MYHKIRKTGYIRCVHIYIAKLCVIMLKNQNEVFFFSFFFLFFFFFFFRYEETGVRRPM